jgi:two-component system, NarL family, response regulator
MRDTQRDHDSHLGPHRGPIITVLCVDDHPIVLDGISQKISAQADMRVVGLATDGRQAVELFERHHPDITLMDLQLPNVSGLGAIRAIRAIDPKARIVVLTMYQGDEDIYRALESGATTYLLKDTLSDDLVKVVREVYAGSTTLPVNVATRLAARSTQRGLTTREVEVLERIAEGMRNKEIGAALRISEETVQVHVKNILSKLGVNDRTAAVTVAFRRGIIHSVI